MSWTKRFPLVQFKHFTPEFKEVLTRAWGVWEPTLMPKKAVKKNRRKSARKNAKQRAKFRKARVRLTKQKARKFS